MAERCVSADAPLSLLVPIFSAGAMLDGAVDRGMVESLAAGTFGALPAPAGCVAVCANAGAAASSATVQAAWSNRACAIVHLLPEVAGALPARSDTLEDVVTARIACHHFMLRARRFVSCVAAEGALYKGLWLIHFPSHDFGTAGIFWRPRIVQK
jgi:hypothetical protein